ncbi:MAG: TetR/AcrR family transcriptional regulator [Streptomyces sp.]|nr:TetR/AcrR family transcriptional regulator [Streptomyces sp.]
MRTGRPRSFDRDEALERAVTVFWRHGYDATSVALLTGALGIGAPSLYAAFGDKKALFLEALDRYLATHGAFTARALAEEPDARAAVGRLLHEACAAYTRPDRPPGCLLITAATNCSPQSEDVAGHLRGIRLRGRAALEARLAADGVPGAAALAAFYAAVLQGMSAQARDGATTADLRRIADTALLAWPGAPAVS